MIVLYCIILYSWRFEGELNLTILAVFQYNITKVKLFLFVYCVQEIV